MYAIMNIKTGKFVYDIKYNYTPHRQKTSKKQMLIYPTQERAELAFKMRGCGKNYRIVVLKKIEVKRLKVVK